MEVKLVNETIVLAAYLTIDYGIPIDNINGVIIILPPIPKVDATMPAEKAIKLCIKRFFVSNNVFVTCPK